MDTDGQPGQLRYDTEGATLVVRVTGDWQLQHRTPAPPEFPDTLDLSTIRNVTVDGAALGQWDTTLLTHLTRISAVCRDRKLELAGVGLPENLKRLWALADAVPEKKDAKTNPGSRGLLERVGSGTLEVGGSFADNLRFLGEVTIAMGRTLTGMARFQRRDLWLLIQQAGLEALPIVAIVSFLLGLILAFVGAIQLEQFGASIFVADLVGIAMVRDMGALITAIVMAGRSGAAYAAQIGSMQVNEETDALFTLGISPVEFLVVPRVLALVLMMPLLTVYADLVGILGGAFVGVTMLDLSFTAYYQQTASAVQIEHIVGGVGKAAVYGVLLAIAGCYRGLRCGRSSSAVGDATTSAVVSGIVSVIAACGAFAWIFYALGL